MSKKNDINNQTLELLEEVLEKDDGKLAFISWLKPDGKYGVMLGYGLTIAEYTDAIRQVNQSFLEMLKMMKNKGNN